MRHAFNWNRVWPYLVGGAPGVAVGVQVLRWANPAYLRIGIAAFLVLYSIYGLMRPALRPIRAGAAADTAVGFVSANWRLVAMSVLLRPEDAEAGSAAETAEAELPRLVRGDPHLRVLDQP